LDEGSRVLLVDDVVSTSGARLRALEQVQSAEVAVTGSVPMVDRSELSRGFFSKLGLGELNLKAALSVSGPGDHSSAPRWGSAYGGSW
jgi:orotate phosphoribosyltransferase